MSEFYTIRTPCAAKPHRCEECRTQIAIGERYSRHSGKQEGYMFDVTVCLRCQGMRSAWWDEFCDQGIDEGPMFGELRRELREEWGIADPEAWYDRILAERAKQAELRAILANAVAAYQGSP